MDRKMLPKMRLKYPALDDAALERVYLFQQLNSGRISSSETASLDRLVKFVDEELHVVLLKNKRLSCMCRKKIDWFSVGNFLKAQCSGELIAASLGIPLDVLYDRCEQERGVSFPLYAQRLKALGCISIHMKQYELAMKGNVPMLIWWGKQYLGQSEKPRTVETQEICQRIIYVSSKKTINWNHA